VHVDPDGRHLGQALQAIAALDARRVTAVRAGLLVYAALFFTEGIGLVLQKHWGKWWGLIVTGSFIPLELYESARRALSASGSCSSTSRSSGTWRGVYVVVHEAGTGSHASGQLPTLG
jgi:uncharacterized membrane protein (DUF2068 family)